VTPTRAHPGTGTGPRAREERAGEGWEGWDEYARFYDWENVRTMGRRDVGYWSAFVRGAGGAVLELGCGTGRVLAPVSRTGQPVVGVDRSAEMLAYARRRLRRARVVRRPALVRADVTALPFAAGHFGAVLAPYGMLQSLLSDAALDDTLASVARVLRPAGRFGIELVPDVPRWREYPSRISLRGRMGRRQVPVVLVERVRQDRARRLTIFDHRYVLGTGRAREVREFRVTFRTLPVSDFLGRLRTAGFRVDAVHGGYRGEPFTPGADTWIVLASKTP
jgi:SAM-dependent methyltransferase